LEELKSEVDELRKLDPAAIEALKRTDPAALDALTKVDPAALDTLKKELHGYLILQSLGLNPDTVKLQRFVPIELYTTESDHKAFESIGTALSKFVGELGIVFTDEFPEEQGSWFKRWFGKTKESLNRNEVSDLLRKGKRTLELVTLEKAQADVSRNLATAARVLSEALGSMEGVARVGSIIAIQYKGQDGEIKKIITELSQEQMEIISCNPLLMKTPAALADLLSAGAGKNNIVSLFYPTTPVEEGDEQPRLLPPREE
jgi:hypothetical protein